MFGGICQNMLEGWMDGRKEESKKKQKETKTENPTYIFQKANDMKNRYPSTKEWSWTLYIKYKN